MRKLMALMFSLSALIPAAAVAEDVMLCDTCSADWQYEQAAIGYVEGRGIPGNHMILVVNDVSEDARWIGVSYSPGGGVPASSGDPSGHIIPAPSASTSEGPTELSDNETLMFVVPRSDNGKSTDDYLRYLEEAIANNSSTAFSIPPTAQELDEITAALHAGRNDYYVVFPVTGMFDTFATRESAAVGLAIYQRLNITLALQSLPRRALRALINLVAGKHGRTAMVCGVFNNGDSACFEPIANAPSGDSYIPGTARDVNGNSLDGGGNGMAVAPEWNNGVIRYGFPGSSGSIGELWLFCAWDGNVLVSCWIQVIQ